MDIDGQVRVFIENEGLLEAGEHVTLGVSGGADSVCLLLLFAELRDTYDLTLDAVHVEHGIRGQEAKEDAAFVQMLCGEYGIPCRVVSVDVPSYRRQHHLSWEEAARKLRYEALFAAAPGKVAAAHHADDNAETMLFQLIRGTGIAGLCGMEPMHRMQDGQALIRPLLCLRRVQIEAYLKERGQTYRTDRTNEDLSLARNKLRRQVFPLLSEINPAAVEHMNHTAALLCSRRRQTEGYAGEILRGVVSDGVLDGNVLLSWPPEIRREVLYLWIKEETKGSYNIGGRHLQQAEALLGTSAEKSVDLPGDHRLQSRYGKLRIVSASGEGAPVVDVGETGFPLAKTEPIPVPRLSDGDCWERAFPCGTISVCVRAGYHENKAWDHEKKIPAGPYVKWLDYDKIDGALFLRNRTGGDFLFFNEKMQKKPLRRFCIDEKIPKGEREHLLLLCCGHHVLWVVGGRISEQAKITAETEQILEIRFQKSNIE